MNQHHIIEAWKGYKASAYMDQRLGSEQERECYRCFLAGFASAHTLFVIETGKMTDEQGEEHLTNLESQLVSEIRRMLVPVNPPTTAAKPTPQFIEMHLDVTIIEHNQGLPWPEVSAKPITSLLADRAAVIRGGTMLGKPTVAIAAKLPDGSLAIIQTTAELFLGLAAAVKATKEKWEAEGN